MPDVNDATDSGEVEQTNEQVRDRQYCQQCGISVRERDYEHKYLQAGGALTGPFCGRDCLFRYLIHPANDTPSPEEVDCDA